MKETDKQKFEAFVKKQTEGGGFSGAIEVHRNGKLWWSFVTGWANEEKEVKNTPETRFNIGSMDKMFTGVAIAQLVERGEIKFEDEVREYVPRLPTTFEGMTIHHILTHTEGCPSYFNDSYIENRAKLKTVDDYLELFVDLPLLFTPGERYRYSNSGYVLLGAVIESVSGRTYSQYVNDNEFFVAGMLSTGLFDFDDKEVACGYTYRRPFSRETTDTKRTNKEDLPFRGSPAGGGYSTCGDLHRFAQALFDCKLLSQKMTELVFEPKAEVGTKNGQTLHYAYGFQVLDVGDGNLRVGHAGAFAGVNGRLDIYPWLDCVIVVLANIDEPAAFRVANEFGELVVGD